MKWWEETRRNDSLDISIGGAKERKVITDEVIALLMERPHGSQSQPSRMCHSPAEMAAEDDMALKGKATLLTVRVGLFYLSPCCPPSFLYLNPGMYPVPQHARHILLQDELL